MSKSQWLKDGDQQGNFSNEKKDTFDPKKGYVGIRLQQGVPLLDRDWNELEDIRRHAEVMLRRYYIGSGVPDENSFNITAADPPANDFKILAGRALVDGFEAVNEPLDADGNPLGFILYKGQASEEPLTIPDVASIVYLDVWIGEVTGATDSALNNPQDVDMETCIRHKLYWQVRVTEASQDQDLPQAPPFHHHYPLARLQPRANNNTIEQTDITDLRLTGLALHLLTDQSNADDKHKHSQLTAPDGSPALVVTNNGSIGIGTTDPDPDIRLVVGGGLRPAIRMRSTDGSNGFIQKLHGDEGVRIFDGEHYAMHWKDGNVGIGTANPGFKFVTSTDVADWTAKILNTNSTAYGLSIENLNSTAGYGLAVYTGSGTGFFVRNNGNVGIGTPNPAAKLDVRGSSNQNAYHVDDGQEDLRVLSSNSRPFDGGIITLGGEGGPTGYLKTAYRNGRAGDIIIGNRRAIDAPRMEPGIVLTMEGNVGIGTQNPGEKLEVRGNINLFDTIETYHDSGHYGRIQLYNGYTGHMTLETYWVGGNSDIILNPDHNVVLNGNVGIGTSSPAAKLDVAGKILSGNYRGSAADVNAYSMEIGGPDPNGTNGQATLYLHHHGVVAHQLRYGNSTLHLEQAVGYGTHNRPNLWVGGSVTQSSGDYAEYFESKDGKGIEAGISVVVDSGKIRAAKKSEIPVGVISASPGIVGGVHIEWPKKYLRDEFGNQVMEEYQEEIMVPRKEKVKKERQRVENRKVKEKVSRTEVVKIKGKYCQKEVSETVEREVEEPVFKEVDLYDAKGKNKIGKHKLPVMETYEEEIDVLDDNGQPVMVGSGKFETKTRPKLNPEYDETKTYIPREKRPEWNCVGLLGQLPLRKGQPTAPTWLKIKDISKDVELWLVK